MEAIVYFFGVVQGATLWMPVRPAYKAHVNKLWGSSRCQGARRRLGVTSESSGNGGRACSEVGRDYSIGSCGEVLSMDV